MNSRLVVTRFAIAASLVSLLAACEKKDTPAPTPTPVEKQATASASASASAAPGEVKIDESLLPAFGVLPAMVESPDNPLTEEKIALGRALYNETRISAGKDLSCNSCHRLDAYGVDGEKTSPGHKKQRGARNSPTVYNAAGHFAQFWDGRAKNVEEQATGPIMNPVEMAMPDEKAVVTELRNAKYEERFKKAFPGDKDPLTLANVGKAIAAFERKLMTPSRWDKFLAGDRSALTAAEKAGFKKFTDTGCNSCHSGPYMGGAMYQKLGVARPWPSTDDPGRFAVTKQETDRMTFKVPSLRNIQKTAPYFHDGSVATLEEAIKKMGAHQLGKDLSDADVASIATFLGALTGELPKAYIASPAAGAPSPAASH